MTVSDTLLAKIRCPVSLEALTIANDKLLNLLNSEINNRTLFNQLGIQVEGEIEQGLVNESQSCFIMVRQGIPDLTPDKTIPIDHLEIPGQG